MKIGDADSSSVQSAKLDQGEQLIRTHDWSLNQQRQVIQHLFPAGDGTQRELQSDMWMRSDLVGLEQILEFPIRGSQMINPDRGINEDHVLLFGAARLPRPDRFPREPRGAGQPRCGQAG